jgi:hypothetical protein
LRHLLPSDAAVLDLVLNRFLGDPIRPKVDLDKRAIMIQDQFAAQIEALIAQARNEGLSDGAIIGVLEDAAEALDEGLP